MSALFNFQSMLVVFLLLTCTCAYIHAHTPRILDAHRQGLPGTFWKLARIGERLSPWTELAQLSVSLTPHTTLSSMSMYVRVKRGTQCIFMFCDPADQLGALKSKAAAVAKIPPDRIRLHPSPTSPPLDDAKTLADQHIGSEGILYMAYKVEGSDAWEPIPPSAK